MPDGLAEYLQMEDPPNYRFPWGYRDITVDQEFWLLLACIDKSKQGWLKDYHIDLWVDLLVVFRQTRRRLGHVAWRDVEKSKGIAVKRYEITYKFPTVIEQAGFYGDCYERVFDDSGDSYKHYLLVSFDMINHRFQEIAIPNLLMRGLDSPLYVSKLQNSIVLSGNIPTPEYYVFVCCQLSINGGSITSFPAIMTMPTHHFTKLLGFNNKDKPIVEAATADVMGLTGFKFTWKTHNHSSMWISKEMLVRSSLIYGVERENEGTVTYIDTDDEGRFKMCFIGFGVAIKSFLCYMRPLIIIDAAHLKGSYLGTNLVAVGMDGNNQIIPIATGVSQGETVARVEGLTSVNNLAKPWFLIKTIKATYAGLFFPVSNE
ncbi:hypothetical protein Tco_0173897 [Tanacetum coccineum]